MKKILLTVGMSTAVIFGMQAQETPEKSEKQEEVIEARGNTESEEYQSESSENQMQFPAEFDSEEMTLISTSQLPKEVHESFKSSDFSEGSINKAYEVKGTAMSQILESRAKRTQYAGDQLPDKLYMLHVDTEDGMGILYLGSDGRSIAEEKVSTASESDWNKAWNEATQQTEEAYESTANEVEEAAAETEESMESAAYETEEAIERTANEVEETTAETEESLENAAYETGEAVEETTNEIEEATQETEETIEGEATEAKETTEAAAYKAEESVKSTEKKSGEKVMVVGVMEREKLQKLTSDFESKGMKKVSTSEVPQEVTDSFENSDFSEGTVEQAYEIDGKVLPEILESRSNLSVYAGEQLPETLYLLHVNHEEGLSVLYIGDDGEIIASEDI